MVILGGGIAGLWTLARLTADGFSALLVEPHALGHGQTIASQGIIHGGVKYTLGGEKAKAASLLAPMPAIWRAALAGGDVDLRGAAVLSEHQHLVSTPGLITRLTSIVAAAAVRSPAHRLTGENRPPPLCDGPSGADVFAMPEQVLDAASLLRAFRVRYEPRLLAAEGPHAVEIDPDGPAVHISANSRRLRVSAGALVLAAGEGNTALLAQAGVAQSDSAAQRRPLHMVMLRGDLPPLYAHWVAAASDKPRLTLTTARDRAGRAIWYLGGDLAETGVGRSREEQIRAARDELREIMPWFELPAAHWATLPIDRVEGRNANGRRPDMPTVRRFGRIIACWPTKLAFAPAAAAEVRRALDAAGVTPTNGPPPDVADWSRPGVAEPPWDREDLTWT